MVLIMLHLYIKYKDKSLTNPKKMLYFVCIDND